MDNGILTVEVDEHASEIHHLTANETKIEYAWNGDAKYWAGRNPTLFPMVGSTYDKILHINGKEYKTGNHGFTRHSDFTCTKHTDTQIEMTLKDNEETLQQYPFHFTLRNLYTLSDNTLTVKTSVTNDSSVVMPFNLGYHPAFNVPLQEGVWEDYFIKTDKEETFSLNGKEVHTSVIPLDREALASTIILTNPNSKQFTLTNGIHGVTMFAENYPWFAVWSPNAPFVCLEPWHSHTDFAEVNVPFEKREGTLFLNPNETFETGYKLLLF